VLRLKGSFLLESGDRSQCDIIKQEKEGNVSHNITLSGFSRCIGFHLFGTQKVTE
jgi:hypothetical protein